MSMMNPEDVEIWRPVVDFEGSYEVSNMGRVRSVDRIVNGQHLRGRIRKLITCPPIGHQELCLSKGGVLCHVQVHIVVLEAFVGPCPPGLHCLHINDDVTDNRLANLQWGTRKLSREAYNAYQRERRGLRRAIVNARKRELRRQESIARGVARPTAWRA
jgi:hypothetical protein